jgi:hypothetical protein
VPRKPKILPANRADFTFGDLVYWHLFRYGTRPNGKPSAKIGRPWQLSRAAGEIKVDVRTIRYWINGDSLPDNSGPLAKALFGNNSDWDNARVELEEKLEAAWLLRDKKADDATAPVTDTAESANADSNDEADDIASEDKELDAGDAEEKESASERSPAALILYGDDTGTSGIGSEPVAESAPAEGKGTNRPRVTPLSALVTSIALLLAAFVWQRLPSRPAMPPAKQSTETTKTDEPHSVAKPIKMAAPIPPPAIKLEEPPAKLPVPVAVPPKVAAPTAPPPASPSPPQPPTEEELRTAEQRRIDEKKIADRMAAHDREMRKRDEEARRLDAANGQDGMAQRQREQDARTAAGMGYTLRENTSAPGSGYRNLLTANVLECARACTSENCDAFGYYRDQYGPGSRQPRYCYLFKKPFTPENHSGYTFGERVADRAFGQGAGLSTVDAPILLAQAGPTPATPANEDGLTRCANGPVKVTGFKLTCDQTLDGGTTLGSTQLRYTVGNINQCAAKCRPVAPCVGFTYNEGDPDGQHACIIFGPTPEGRESKGWISGAR